MSSVQPTRKEGSAALSRDDVEALRQREAKPGSPVLSVYLDTDQSREINIERGFEVVLKDMLREIGQKLDKATRKEFDADAERVQQFVEEYRDVKRGLAVFCDASDKFLWHKELNVNMRNGAKWNETPYVRPLIEILDEHERYGVVLADRRQARFFTIFLGEIEEHARTEAQLDVRHINSPGTDHIESQMTIQHKADQHAHNHLKHAAELTAGLANIREFDRLILAGTDEATSELHGLLPKALRARVVRKIPLPVEASEAQVLEATSKIEEEVERQHEAELVEQLITAGAKREKGVLGLNETVLAMQEGRVWQLVYADGFVANGAQCANCLGLLAKDTGPCDYCNGPVQVVDDLIGLLAERVLDMQGKVEQVGGPAAERLRKVGSVGAFLRY
jgi:peptide chain release factor subunit 1